MIEKNMDSENVKSLNNDFTKIQTLKNINDRRKQYVRQVHKRRLYLIAILLSIVTAFLGLQIFQTHRNTQQLQSQVQMSKTQLQKAQTQNTDLKQNVQQLNNADYLEKVIREKYYYSKPGEIIFSLPGDKPQN
ncbi:FtsB family cell division protein [Agrilactobacillus fermenti]|uniref:FtsB family cell division protein n=1 Tax=Agrilactobacillus fermenti TaxID=2586909 RepID=UPI001E33D14C|nr:septum formation initiator family protein [Agrilactobacillus fermenti]MCD2255943.1 septum formation initiator family protein [Agrilactobacillus fermenti]